MLELQDEIYRREIKGKTHKFGQYKCSFCGAIVEKYYANRNQKSCGCQRGVTHGGKGTRLYDIWCHMKQRCYDENSKDYKYYGAKGIKIQSEFHDFARFRDWATSSGYEDTLTVDRLKSDKWYSSHNCQWITQSENSKRMALKFKKAVHCLDLFGAILSTHDSVTECAKSLKIDKSNIFGVLSGRRTRYKQFKFKWVAKEKGLL